MRDSLGSKWAAAMVLPRQVTCLLIASLAESLINFRGPLIAALQARGLQVHVAAPDLPQGDPIREQLQALGVVVHSVALRRTGTNPLAPETPRRKNHERPVHSQPSA